MSMKSEDGSSIESAGIITVLAVLVVCSLMMLTYLISVSLIPGNYACKPVASEPICGNKGCKGDNTVVHGYVSTEP